MKKIVLFIAFIMTGLFVQAQDSQLKRAQLKELDLLEKTVTYEHENLAFTTNQRVKLERILMKKAQELVDLRNTKDLEKSAYAIGYKNIEDKYQPDIEAVMSPEQRIAYRKNKKKQIKKLKD